MDSRGRLWEIPLKMLMHNATQDIEMNREEKAVRIPYKALRHPVDTLYTGLHEKCGEDGCLQGVPALLKVPCVDSGVPGSTLGMDKYMSRKVPAMNGIDVPLTKAVRRDAWRKEAESVCGEIKEVIAFSCAVKPSREGCSTAVDDPVSTGRRFGDNPGRIYGSRDRAFFRGSCAEARSALK